MPAARTSASCGGWSENVSRRPPTISLLPILVPWVKAIAVQPGPVCPTTLDRLAAAGFGQAPMLEGDRPLGIVTTRHLRELHAAGRPLDAGVPTLIRTRLPVEADLLAVLGALAEEPAAIVESHDGSTPGFVTLSDLNRHHFRAAIYPLLAELEAGLASLVEARFKDPWEWLDRLDRNRQALIVGHWEIAKRSSIDVGPIAAATLTELVDVCGSDPQLRNSLGLEKVSRSTDPLGGICELRHSIMHPVRPLLHDAEDAKQLARRISAVLALLARVASATAGRG
jgi:hypothetical protein